MSDLMHTLSSKSSSSSAISLELELADLRGKLKLLGGTSAESLIEKLQRVEQQLDLTKDRLTRAEEDRKDIKLVLSEKDVENASLKDQCRELWVQMSNAASSSNDSTSLIGHESREGFGMHSVSTDLEWLASMKSTISSEKSKGSGKSDSKAGLAKLHEATERTEFLKAETESLRYELTKMKSEKKILAEKMANQMEKREAFEILLDEKEKELIVMRDQSNKYIQQFETLKAALSHREQNLSQVFTGEDNDRKPEEKNNTTNMLNIVIKKLRRDNQMLQVKLNEKERLFDGAISNLEGMRHSHINTMSMLEKVGLQMKNEIESLPEVDGRLLGSFSGDGRNPDDAYKTFMSQSESYSTAASGSQAADRKVTFSATDSTTSTGVSDYESFSTYAQSDLDYQDTSEEDDDGIIHRQNDVQVLPDGNFSNRVTAILAKKHVGNGKQSTGINISICQPSPQNCTMIPALMIKAGNGPPASQTVRQPKVKKSEQNRPSPVKTSIPEVEQIPNPALTQSISEDFQSISGSNSSGWATFDSSEENNPPNEVRNKQAAIEYGKPTEGIKSRMASLFSKQKPSDNEVKTTTDTSRDSNNFMAMPPTVRTVMGNPDDGTPRNGTPRNGTPRNGTPRNGIPQNNGSGPTTPKRSQIRTPRRDTPRRNGNVILQADSTGIMSMSSTGLTSTCTEQISNRSGAVLPSTNPSEPELVAVATPMTKDRYGVEEYVSNAYNHTVYTDTRAPTKLGVPNRSPKQLSQNRIVPIGNILNKSLTGDESSFGANSSGDSYTDSWAGF